MHKFTDRHNLRAGWLVAFCLLMLFCSLESRAYSDQGQKGSPGADRLSLSVLLNEIVVNPNGGDDNCEYIELLGFANEPLSSIYFVSLEGDSTSNEGAADFVSDLGALSLGPNGLLVITAMDTTGVCGTRTYNSPPTVLVRDADLDGGRLENGTNSWLLVSSPTTAILEGTDYDTDDNGTLEGLPADALILDAVGWTDGGGADINYGGVVLPSTAGGTNDMATRFPGDATPNSAAAWYHGDMDGATNSLLYDLTQVSANFPAGGMLTPGDVNAPTATTPQPPNVDFDGDGVSDYSTVRDETPGLRKGGASPRFSSIREKMWAMHKTRQQRPHSNLGDDVGSTNVWYIRNSQAGDATVSGFGTASTDFVTPSDFDGDGKTDLAVWRGTGPTTGSFFILQSSDGMMVEEIFGQQNDNPTVVGDYDGDGKSDPAVFRCPPLGGGDGQCFFFFRGSDSNPGGDITYVPWGFGETFDFFPNPGDFDGDGKYDFCIQRVSPTSPSNGQFVLLNSSDSSVEYITWGGPIDFIIPGDYDGDGKSDFMVRRSGSNPFEWYLLESDGGGTGAAPIFWGTTGDSFAPGDYDGDGITDIGIWRSSPTPTSNLFYILRSSDGALESIQWGLQTDFPVAGWNVN